VDGFARFFLSGCHRDPAAAVASEHNGDSTAGVAAELDGSGPQ
jgi:hypothetical protein